MKKMYLTCLSILSLSAVIAQENTGSQEHKPVSSDQVIESDDRPSVLGQDRAPDQIHWSDDFSNAANWVADGPQMDANNGWSIGNSTQDGWASFQYDDMGTTGDFARLFVENPATITQGPLTFTYQGTIPDLTSVPAPHLEWEQYGARFITLQEVQISTDGGTTWVTAGSNADITPLTQGGGSPYGHPETRRFPISSAISGNPANVMIRLFWDGDQNGPNINYIDYGWFVDDIRIVEGHSYDLQENASVFVSGAELLEYYIVPTTQLTGIEFSGQMTNQGAATMPNAMLQVDVDMGGNVFTGTSTPADLPSNSTDSVVVNTLFTPASGVGTYNLTWSYLGDSADTFTGNEDHTDAIEVHDYTYARDNGNQTGGFTNWSGGSGQPAGIGNVMEIFADGQIGAVDIYIGANAASSDIVYGRIDLYNSGTQTFDWQGQTDDYTLTAGDVNDWVKLFFDPPIQVYAGDVLLLTANHYGTDTEFGMAQPTILGTVAGYDGGGTLFSLSSPEAIMIRADMRDFTSVEETSNPFSIGQNVPNPFDNNSTIQYTLDEGADVSVVFTDAAGRIVRTINNGMQNAGSYQINIDANEFSEGVYFYTFLIGDKEVTKRMIVK